MASPNEMPAGSPVVSPASDRYWAFISYSHQDERWAAWLHTRLETYTGHKKLVGTPNRYGEPVPARPFPVFRDRDELEGAPDLPDRIQEALQRSRFLIVICSPAAAKSQWVDQEIRTFKALGREDRVLAIIVAGEPHAGVSAAAEECFPPALKFRVGADRELTGERTEPLAADARPKSDGKRGALLKLLAAIIGVRFDDLKQRDLERQRRFWRRVGLAAAVSVVVLLALTIFAFTQRNEAVRQRDVAEQRARDALSRQLAVSAEAAIEPQLDRGLVLAAYAAQVSPTIEARRVLRSALRRMPTLERFLTSAGSGVLVLAVEASGRLAAVGRADGSVDIFDIDTGQRQPGDAVRLAHPPFRLAFSAGDPGRVLAVSRDAGLRSIRDARMSEPVDLRIEEENLLDADFTPDGTRLATFDVTRRLAIWDVTRWPPVRQQTVQLPEATEHPIRFAGTNDRVVLFADRALVTVDLHTGTAAVEKFDDQLRERFLIGPSGREVAGSTGVGDNEYFTVYDVGTRTRAFTLGRKDSQHAFAIAFSPDGTQAATANESGTITIQQRSGPPADVRMPPQLVSALAFDPAGRRLIAGGASGAVMVWRAGPAPPTRDRVLDDPCQPARGPRHMALSPNGAQLVMICDESVVKLAPLNGPGAVTTISIPGNPPVKGVAFLDENRVVVLLGDGRAALVDVRQQTGTSASSFVDGLKSGVALSRNRGAVAILLREGEVLTWKTDQASGEPLRFRLPPPGDWNALAIGADGTTLAASTAEGRLVHIETSTNRVTTLLASGDKLTNLALSPDGRSLTWIDERARAGVRDLQTNTTRAIEGVRAQWVDDTGPLVSPSEGMIAKDAEYSPDGRYLAVATDGGILLLDPATMQRLGNPVSRSSGSTSLAFDANGSLMARVFRTSSQTTSLSVEVEALATESLIRSACAVVNRELTEAEIQTYLSGVAPTLRCADALRAQPAGQR